MDARGPDGLTLAAFAAAVTIGAGNFVAVSFSNRELDPFWGAALRFGLAALIFVAIALALRLTWPRGRLLALTVVYGALSFAAFYALMYWALVRVSAGVATVVMAVVPLLTVLLAAAQGLERLRWRSAVGALLACAGILWMTLGPREVVLPLTALAAMLTASVCVAQAVILGKRIADNHPAMTNAVGMLVGTVGLLALSVVAGETWALPQRTEVIVAVAYLVTLGSAGLFVLVLLIVRRWTASATSYMFVLFPVVTLLLDAWLADVPVTVEAATGAALVMAGVWFGALSPGARAAALPVAPDPQAVPAE
jgi:drug/metabolite transporter (DMT)-like permease